MNIAHISQGEISLSLWDLSTLGGLPCSGLFYYEVVPTKRLFSTIDKQGKKVIHPGCQYLFVDFRHLCEGSKKTLKVSASKWINFWYRGVHKYQVSAKHGGRKNDTQLMDFPSGAIANPFDLSEEKHGAFVELAVNDVYREEIYLAAFISCWI
ncbi:hypothetical protein ACH5RR_003345 [Cinchona calisaya]|uniref:Uncharacterized protein n=1 Tax=Cinchona calisaya TaxID=153742 RepID=A0ABD3AUJ3_9GENT